MCTFVCAQHALICVFACACICISLLGTLSILTQKLCLHFHFPSPGGPSPNLGWQLLSTRQAGPPSLASVLCCLAPDASQLVCRLCGTGRLLETDARATVGLRLRIDLCQGPALGPHCDLYCWKTLWKEWGASAACSCASIYLNLSVLLLSQGHTADLEWTLS